MKAVLVCALIMVVAASAQQSPAGLGLTQAQVHSAIEALRSAVAAGTSVSEAMRAWAHANLNADQQAKFAARRDQIEALFKSHNIAKRATFGDGQRLAQAQAKVDQLRANATPEQQQKAAEVKQKLVDELNARGFTGQTLQQVKDMLAEGKTPAEIHAALQP